jgi:hypothetical protein
MAMDESGESFESDLDFKNIELKAEIHIVFSIE